MIDQIADLLGQHMREPGHRDMAAHCTCGWVSETPGLRDAFHQNHVAEQIMALLHRQQEPPC